MLESHATEVALLIIEALAVGGAILAWLDGKHRGAEDGRQEGVEFGVHHGIHEERHRWCEWIASQPYPPPLEDLQAFCAAAGITLTSERISPAEAVQRAAKAKHRPQHGCRCSYCGRQMPHLPPDYGFAVCAACQDKE